MVDGRRDETSSAEGDGDTEVHVRRGLEAVVPDAVERRTGRAARAVAESRAAAGRIRAVMGRPAFNSPSQAISVPTSTVLARW